MRGWDYLVVAGAYVGGYLIGIALALLMESPFGSPPILGSIFGAATASWLTARDRIDKPDRRVALRHAGLMAATCVLTWTLVQSRLDLFEAWRLTLGLHLAATCLFSYWLLQGPAATWIGDQDAAGAPITTSRKLLVGAGAPLLAAAVFLAAASIDPSKSIRLVQRRLPGLTLKTPSWKVTDRCDVYAQGRFGLEAPNGAAEGLNLRWWFGDAVDRTFLQTVMREQGLHLVSREPALVAGAATEIQTYEADNGRRLLTAFWRSLIDSRCFQVTLAPAVDRRAMRPLLGRILSSVRHFPVPDEERKTTPIAEVDVPAGLHLVDIGIPGNLAYESADGRSILVVGGSPITAWRDVEQACDFAARGMISSMLRDARVERSDLAFAPCASDPLAGWTFGFSGVDETGTAIEGELGLWRCARSSNLFQVLYSASGSYKRDEAAAVLASARCPHADE